MSEWISVKDKLPDTGTIGTSTEVLMLISYADGSEIITMPMTGFYTFFEDSAPYEDKDGVLRIDGKWDWAISSGPRMEGTRIDKMFAVTHWMPLPDNPDGITTDLIYELDGYDFPELDEDDEPGKMTTFLSRSAKIPIDGGEDGIPIDNIIKELSPAVADAFKAVIDALVAQPDPQKRCEKYADALDDFDKRMGDFALFQSDWRAPWNNFVVLENYPESVIKQLCDLNIEQEYENADFMHWGIFGSHCHIELDDDLWIDAINVYRFIVVTNDGRILKLEDKEEAKQCADSCEH